MDLIIFARELGHAIFEFFILPGTWILARILDAAPILGSLPGIAGNTEPILLPLFLALLVWVLLVAVTQKIVGWLRDIGRIMVGTFENIQFRFSLALHNLKRSLVSFLQIFSSWRRSVSIDTDSIEFNDLDIAILRATATQPPGIAVSAPDLAESFTMRPSQIQRRLQWLTDCKMLECVIGSTDGFFDGFALRRG